MKQFFTPQDSFDNVAESLDFRNLLLHCRDYLHSMKFNFYDSYTYGLDSDSVERVFDEEGFPYCVPFYKEAEDFTLNIRAYLESIPQFTWTDKEGNTTEKLNPEVFSGEVSPYLFGNSTNLKGHINPKLTGDVSGLVGELSPNLYGRVSPWLKGDVTGLKGDISFLQGTINPELTGFCSGIKGFLNPNLKGDCTNINGYVNFELLGDCSGLMGTISGLTGDCSEVKGRCSGITLDCTGLSGDIRELQYL